MILRFSRAIVLFVVFAIPVFLFSQQLVDDNALLDEAGTLTYHSPVNGHKYQAMVAPQVIAKYPESNYQYAAYLNDLRDSGDSTAYEAALPNPLLHGLPMLDSAGVAFFRDAYLFQDEFMRYPILGLSAIQWSAYFDWKSSQLIEAWYTFRNEGKKSLPPLDTMLQAMWSDGLLVAGYRLPTRLGLQSIFKNSLSAQTTIAPAIHPEWFVWLKQHYRYRHLSVSQLTNKAVTHPLLDRFGIKPSWHYGLPVNRRAARKVRALRGAFTAIDDEPFTGVLQLGPQLAEQVLNGALFWCPTYYVMLDMTKAKITPTKLSK